MYLDIKIIMWFNSLRIDYKINEHTYFDDFKNSFLQITKMIMINTIEHQKLFYTDKTFLNSKDVIKCIEKYYLHNKPYKPSYLLYEYHQKISNILLLNL